MVGSSVTSRNLVSRRMKLFTDNLTDTETERKVDNSGWTNLTAADSEVRLRPFRRLLAATGGVASTSRWPAVSTSSTRSESFTRKLYTCGGGGRGGGSWPYRKCVHIQIYSPELKQHRKGNMTIIWYGTSNAENIGTFWYLIYTVWENSSYLTKFGWDQIKVWILKGESSHSKLISKPFLLLSER